MSVKLLSFTVPGIPRGKQRARTLKTGHSYTPAETVHYENLVKMCFNERKPDGWTPWQGKVGIHITACFQIPAATSKKHRAAMILGEICPLKKPDADNCIKIITDALNQIAYRDDAQIWTCSITKRYAEDPRVEVHLHFS